jgi:hypothetical protein
VVDKRQVEGPDTLPSADGDLVEPVSSNTEGAIVVGDQKPAGPMRRVMAADPRNDDDRC